jgi:hypothetical protein
MVRGDRTLRFGREVDALDLKQAHVSCGRGREVEQGAAVALRDAD